MEVHIRDQPQSKSVNGTNVIVLFIAQYERKNRPKRRNDQLPWSIWKVKMKLFKIIKYKRNTLGNFC